MEVWNDEEQTMHLYVLLLRRLYMPHGVEPPSAEDDMVVVEVKDDEYEDEPGYSARKAPESSLATCCTGILNKSLFSSPAEVSRSSTELSTLVTSDQVDIDLPTGEALSHSGEVDAESPSSGDSAATTAEIDELFQTPIIAQATGTDRTAVSSMLSTSAADSTKVKTGETSSSSSDSGPRFKIRSRLRRHQHPPITKGSPQSEKTSLLSRMAPGSLDLEARELMMSRLPPCSNDPLSEVRGR